MTHAMKLWNAPFESIKSGKKKIEMRLYDEKRALLSVGDTIVFTNADTGEQLLRRVKALYKYANFEELYARHDRIEIGYKEGEKVDPKDMLAYYSQEKIERYGVVAIVLEGCL